VPTPSNRRITINLESVEDKQAIESQGRLLGLSGPMLLAIVLAPKIREWRRRQQASPDGLEPDE